MSQPQPGDIRDTLFGDLPPEGWPASPQPAEEEPWASFARARQHLAAGRPQEAAQQLQGVLNQPGLESRHYLQAWHFLRAAGFQPPQEWAQFVLGVVVEVGMPGGVDLVAAYTDGSARFYSHGGGGVVWEAPNDSLANEVGALLQAGTNVAQRIGPWDKARPAAPRDGMVRLNMLTPSGLHFGEGPFQVLAGDAMGGPIISAALALMQRLIALSESR